MAHHDTLPSDLSFLLDYLEQLPYESDSDCDEFMGYLDPDDGPVIICYIDSAGYEDPEPTSSPYHSHLLDITGQECESSLPRSSSLFTLKPGDMHSNTYRERERERERGREGGREGGREEEERGRGRGREST